MGIISHLRGKGWSFSSVVILASLLYIGFLIVPPILALLWGILLIVHESTSFLFGLTILILGTLMTLLPTSFMLWKANNWRLGLLQKVVFFGAPFIVFLYALLFYTESTGDYSGCTALFLSINYSFACYLILTRGSSDKLNTQILVD
mmetsp:Transcript_9897/g.9744  ORF Transcript_9897/g.9744 Transcript_9897/m.9744 type:complete len:147 (-) Transcript_9897:2550-2990(-)